MPTTAPPLVLQIGANSHSGSIAHAHDPVPFLIAHGWAATLLEPQPPAAAALRELYHKKLSATITVRGEAVCTDVMAATATLWYINATKTLGSNHSDARCMGDFAAASGTASLSRGQVVQYQRFYRYTPSQCAACSLRLQRPLPPSCMARVYLDNLESVSVPCARFDVESLGTVDALVIDAEGADAAIVTRYLDVARTPPQALVYEHAFLHGPTRAKLAARLNRAGMVRFGKEHELPRRGGAAGRTRRGRRGPWAALRLALSRVDTRQNSVWLLVGNGSRNNPDLDYVYL